MDHGPDLLISRFVYFSVMCLVSVCTDVCDPPPPPPTSVMALSRLGVWCLMTECPVQQQLRFTLFRYRSEGKPSRSPQCEQPQCPQVGGTICVWSPPSGGLVWAVCFHEPGGSLSSGKDTIPLTFGPCQMVGPQFLAADVVVGAVSAA